MMNARYEMDTVLFRTAMSPGIREQHDEFPMIANLEGKMVVGQFGSFIYGFKEAYDGTIEEGDLFLTTDPYSCRGAISHINDWLLLRPIFKDGRLIAYAAMFGHMTDVGGKVPGVSQMPERYLRKESASLLRKFLKTTNFRKISWSLFCTIAECLPGIAATLMPLLLQLEQLKNASLNWRIALVTTCSFLHWMNF